MRIEIPRLFLFVTILLSLAHGQICIAQAPPTIDSALKKYGIPITPQSLQFALKDGRPEVRGLAASELASVKDMGSVPLIVEALEREKDQQARFNIASALVRLDSPSGIAVLAQICDDTAVPEDRRLSAASRLFNTGNLSCLSSTENILEKTQDPSIKVSALLMMSRLKPIPGSLVPRIHDTLIISLRNSNSAVRGYAARCIAALGDKAATADLRTAISIESDPTSKDRMEESLTLLESRP